MVTVTTTVEGVGAEITVVEVDVMVVKDGELGTP